MFPQVDQGLVSYRVLVVDNCLRLSLVRRHLLMSVSTTRPGGSVTGLEGVRWDVACTHVSAGAFPQWKLLASWAARERSQLATSLPGQINLPRLLCSMLSLRQVDSKNEQMGSENNTPREASGSETKDKPYD